MGNSNSDGDGVGDNDRDGDVNRNGVGHGQGDNDKGRVASSCAGNVQCYGRGDTLPPPPWTQRKVHSPALCHGGDTAKSVSSLSRGRVPDSSPWILFLFIVYKEKLFIYLALAKPALPGQFVLFVLSQSKGNASKYFCLFRCAARKK
jgi:hypothetical protein